MRNDVRFLREVAIAEGVITVVVRIEKIVRHIAAGERFHIRQYFPCHIFVDVGIHHENTVFADNNARIIHRFRVEISPNTPGANSCGSNSTPWGLIFTPCI